MSELRVANVATEIEPIFWDAMYANRRPEPGFQIGPAVPIAECLEILQLLMRDRLGLGHFTFNEILDNAKSNSMFGRHIDSPKVEMGNAGIAVHESLSGPGGTVTLELAKIGAKNAYSNNSTEVGQVFTGKIFPGVKTIFSEGIDVRGLDLTELELEGVNEESIIAIRGITAVSMGPAIHTFMSGSDGLRSWRRFTFNKQRPPVPLDLLLAS